MKKTAGKLGLGACSRQRYRWRVAGTTALALVGAVAIAPPAQADWNVSCGVYSVPVALTAGQPASSTVIGELCATDGERTHGTTVQLLIHGGTYNHGYWDFGTIDGVRYSYARDLALAGFPTFSIDQIGQGQSSKPPSSVVTNETVAYVDHQVVQALRAGGGTPSAPGAPQLPKFGKVIEVGHSFGSFAAWQEAISYQDVDGLIVTGTVHHTSQNGSSTAFADLYPASADSKYQGQQWAAADPGYLTTMPGTRAPLFYNPGDADPNVIAADDNQTPFGLETFGAEQGKDVVSGAQFDAFALGSSTATQAIHVPVLVILGSDDLFACGPNAQGQNFDCSSGTAIAQQEAPYYSPQAQLRACSVPNSGHDINLHENFWVQEVAAATWSYGIVGQDGYASGTASLPAACG